MMLLSKCAVCDHTKLSFIKKQEASWLLSKPSQVKKKKRDKTNETVNTDEFMPEMHLKQPEFTYSACEPFIKNKERI